MFIELLKLFFIFFKIGLFTFGRGYAMIPLIRDEVLANGWLTEEALMNFIAVAESTPGPIAVNMATFIGSSQHGILGAIFATLGVVLPSFIKLAGVKWALKGIKPVVAGLILGTGATLLVSIVFGIKTVESSFSFDYISLIIFGVMVIASIVYKLIAKKELSPIILIIASAGLGMALYSI